MSPLQIVIRPRSDNFQDLIRFGEMLANPPGDIDDAAIGAVGEIVRGAASRNFGRGGSGHGSWNPLAPRTVQERVRLGYGGTSPILIRTGAYAGSFTGGNEHVEDSYRSGGVWTIAIGSDDYRATTHEFGRDQVPARPVLIFGEDVETDIEQALIQVFDDVERRTRGG